MIYFELGSAKLTPSALQRLDKAVAEVKRGGLIWGMAGHADRSGDAASNMELSRRRLNVVRDYLVRAGVDLRRTLLKAHGETQPMVSAADGIEQAGDRRVEIWVAIPMGR
jgi:outer membrane protein OmpA-like peptidoglycan-associated protein